MITPVKPANFSHALSTTGMPHQSGPPHSLESSALVNMVKVKTRVYKGIKFKYNDSTSYNRMLNYLQPQCTPYLHNLLDAGVFIQ